MHCKVAAQPGQNGRVQIKLFQFFHKSYMENSVKCLLEVKKYTAYSLYSGQDVLPSRA